MSIKPQLSIFLVVFIDLLGFGIMIPMLPFYARSFGASTLEVGALMFVYSFMQIFSAPLWGNLSDRFGRRPVLLTTILGQALCFLVAAFAPTYGLLLVSRLMAGLFAGNISTAQAYMSDVTPPEERAKGMGLIGAAFGLGFIFGPAIGGILISHGAHWPSLVAGGIGLANFILSSVILKESLTDLEARKKNRHRWSLSTLNDILQNPRLFIPMITFFLSTMAFVQLEVTFGLFVLDKFSFSEKEAGLLLATLGVLMAIVQGGLIGRLNRIYSEKILVFCGLSLNFLGLAGLALSPSFAWFMASLILLALGYALTNPSLSSLVSKASPAGQRGAYLGVYQSSSGVARILAPLSAGVAYDRQMNLPFLVGAGFLLIAGLLWQRLPRTERADSH